MKTFKKQIIVKFIMSIILLSMNNAYAQTWGDVAFSGILNANELCYTDGKNVICDAGLTVNGAAALDVSGTVSATAFVGDGSALTGVVATGADWYGLTNIPTGVSTISDTALVTAELQQLQNIDTTTISAAQFGYVGTMDQAVATTDAVTFADVSVTTNLDVAGDVSVTGRFDVTDISATGIIQATTFIGDGSALTGLSSLWTDSTDYIVRDGFRVYVSGTTIDMTGIDNVAFWDEEKGAFWAGASLGINWNEAFIGRYSTNFGTGYAQGDYSVSLGRDARATANDSVAMGYYARASGVRSLAFSSTASGTDSISLKGKATANNAISIANYGEASGSSSIAIGSIGTLNSGAQARASSSIALGINTDTWPTASKSNAIGYGSEVSGTRSTSIGYGMLVTGNDSFGIGVGVGADNILLADNNTLAIMGASGGVGIGKVSPAYELDVSGTIFADTVSATTFIGDGSALTGVVATGADWYGLTNIPTGVADISNTALITAELQQLQNIDTTTISVAQFGYVGTMDQAVATTDAVTFADVSVTTNLDVAGDVSVTGRFDVADISATGIIQATTFIGDGSALTGVVATSITLAITDLTDAKYDGSSLFLGSGAGANDDGTANNNTAVGFQALNANRTGSGNVANGYQALFSNVTGFANVANGSYALYSNITGNNNVANGFYALYLNTTGFDNVANGSYALNGNTTGNYNVANGSYALASNTTGNDNIANGYRALFFNTTGNYNIANGYAALYFNGTGNYNVANGYAALYFNTTGSSNLALGYQAQYGVNGSSTGSYNVSLGHEANKLLTTGNNNIAIGASVTVANVAGNDQLNIGNTLYGDLANDYIGIGLTAPNVALDVSGSIEYTGVITDVSDRRLKDNIKDLPKGQLEKIIQVNPVSFVMKDNPSETEYGVIAQDLEKIYPLLVKTANDTMGTKSVNYIGLITPMIQAIQELKAEMGIIKKQNIQQQALIEKLLAR